MERKRNRCMNCGEVREHAAHGLCFMCYRREERQSLKDDGEAVIDRHAPGIRKEQKRILRGFASVMTGLADIGAGHDQILQIRAILNPFLASVSHYLEGGNHGEQ